MAVTPRSLRLLIQWHRDPSTDGAAALPEARLTTPAEDAPAPRASAPRGPAQSAAVNGTRALRARVHRDASSAELARLADLSDDENAADAEISGAEDAVWARELADATEPRA